MSEFWFGVATLLLVEVVVGLVYIVATADAPPCDDPGLRDDFGDPFEDGDDA